MKKILSVITVFTLFISVSAKSLIPGGESCGVNLRYDGVLVTGCYAFFDEKNNRYLNENEFIEGDLIISCNQIKVDSINKLINVMQNSMQNCEKLFVEVIRKGKTQVKELDVCYDVSSNSFKTGLYIVDHLSAIGTITYYDPENQTYGAFGHHIDVNNTNINFSTSEIFISLVSSIEPNSNSATGRKIACIDKTKRIGTVNQNIYLGIYGSYINMFKDNQNTIETGYPQIGKALIYTTLEDNQTNAYEIYIESIRDNNHDIILKVTDEALLSITNGIIPGMSGSPIIQEGKLVGAVTHVLVNDPTRGYGIFIENMLEVNER